MIVSDDIRQAIAALRYHNRKATLNEPGYLGSSLEKDSLEAITALSDLLKRMTESNRSDFIGGEI